MAAPLWSPKAGGDRAIDDLQKFAGVDSYAELHLWSVRNSEKFWNYVFSDSQIVGDFQSLNIVDSLLKGDSEAVIITDIDEAGNVRSFSRGQTREISNQVAERLQSMDIGVGDVVAAITANVAETIFMALGALRLGAIFTSASADFGVNTILDRFSQVDPKILLATTSYQYNGKSFDCLAKISEIQAKLRSLKEVVVLGSTSSKYPEFYGWISKVQPATNYSVKGGFDRPGFILFSSGTTGKPKCIVHSAAGVLLKVMSEQRLHLDIKSGDRVFYYTTCGWMMWNWLFMSLATGAHIFLYEGNPTFPNMDRLFDLVQENRITFLGLSAKYIDTIRKSEINPKQTHDLKSLRTIASTGSVLSPECFKYIYQEVATDIHLASISGGTDICGCFLLGNPSLPVYEGQIQVPALGLDVQVFDESGSPVGVGEKGELVCLNSFPSAPLYFFGDSDGSKYKSAYFERFPGIWTHGDFVEPTAQGGFVMHGRSDATLNSGGVRIGTAEIYRIVEEFAQIEEALAVAQPWEGDTRVILFLKLAHGVNFSRELETEIRGALREKASPRHVPALILVAPELPKTKTNKLAELAVTRILAGVNIDNESALANPQALDWFRNLNL